MTSRLECEWLLLVQPRDHGRSQLRFSLYIYIHIRLFLQHYTLALIVVFVAVVDEVVSVLVDEVVVDEVAGVVVVVDEVVGVVVVADEVVAAGVVVVGINMLGQRQSLGESTST